MIDELETNRETFAKLCRQFAFTFLSVFGSAVDGSFDPDTSDLDFLVRFDPASAHSRFTRSSDSRMPSKNPPLVRST